MYILSYLHSLCSSRDSDFFKHILTHVSHVRGPLQKRIETAVDAVLLPHPPLRISVYTFQYCVLASHSRTTTSSHRFPHPYSSSSPVCSPYPPPYPSPQLSLCITTPMGITLTLMFNLSAATSGAHFACYPTCQEYYECNVPDLAHARLVAKFNELSFFFIL